MLICKTCPCRSQQLLSWIKSGKNARAKLLLRHIPNPLGLTDSSGKTLLHLSVKHRNLPMAKHLLETGWDANAEDKFGATPLLTAVQKRDVAMVTTLLINHAELCLPDYTGTSPLQLAARQCFLVEPNGLTTSDRLINPGILRILVMRVDSPVRGEHLVRTLLDDTDCLVKLALVIFAREELQRRVLDSDEAIANHRVDRYGHTALHCAVMFAASPRNVKILMEYGANVEALNAAGHSPLYYYTGEFQNVDGDSEVLKLLLTTSPPRAYELEQLLAQGNVRTVRAALKSGIDFTFEHGRSVLFPLAVNKNPEAIREIDELNSVDVNARDDETGATALYHAAQRGRPEQVEFLLDRGADPNLPLNSGETILQAALKTVYFDYGDERQMEMARVVESLLQRGALVSRPIWKYELCTVKSRLSTRIVMSHLAMLYLLDDEARLVTREDIEAVTSGYYERFFRSCVRELEALKAVEVSGEVTLFQLLVEGDERIVGYHRDPEFFEAFEREMDKLPDLETYYFTKLYRRTVWAIETIALRREVETVIEGLTGLCSDVYRDIVLRIIGYLKLSDLRNLRKVC